MFSIRPLISSKPQVSILGSLASARSVSLLSRLQPSHDSTHKARRLGRGASSTKGKTSGRGQKGQKARGSVKPWFEGGQTPIYKLFPKIGFNSKALQLNELNLERIAQFYKDGRLGLKEGEVLTMRQMKKCGLVTGTLKDGVKILASGKEKFKYPLKIEATRASAEAIKTIEKHGGEFTARYFTKLGLRAHLHPLYFLKTRGHIPLPGRPLKRKYIEYYMNPLKRGYLIKEKGEYYQTLMNARNKKKAVKVSKTNALESLLSNMKEGNKSSEGFVNSGVFKFEDLKL